GQTTTTTAETTEASLTNDTTLNNDWSYCFEFTWFGPGYDNFTLYNVNGTPPDIDYLFEHHKTSVLCRRTANQVCARYTYKYNGVVNNATYMCTKVQEVGGGAITSGCYSQEVDGYDVELCVCESGSGIVKPCNGALQTLFH
ncbi:uncharacterized protein BDFB_009207, partial [Asbolus verrucosus]